MHKTDEIPALEDNTIRELCNKPAKHRAALKGGDLVLFTYVIAQTRTMPGA